MKILSILKSLLGKVIETGWRFIKSLWYNAKEEIIQYQNNMKSWSTEKTLDVLGREAASFFGGITLDYVRQRYKEKLPPLLTRLSYAIELPYSSSLSGGIHPVQAMSRCLKSIWTKAMYGYYLPRCTINGNTIQQEVLNAVNAA